MIGKNDNWKQNINLGKRTNQNFTNIPYARFIQQLEYKAQIVGIEVTIIEENYISKCGFLDLEPIEKQENYLGKSGIQGREIVETRIYLLRLYLTFLILFSGTTN
ncbi:MAG: IS200/IS605 family element transposase accessory protein TnpB [Hydrococcus sp. C42_A2020_068]|nr:IS200/IS605 family element transposase accessory protein TnpB [Hydrococcus sp. C42_A2020_068]